MAFTPVRYDEGKLITLACAASVTFVKGDAVKNASGYITPSASGDNTDVEFVAMEGKTTGGSTGELLQCVKVRGTEFVVDCSNTPTQAQMLTQVDLSAAGTIDTSATTDQVFFAAQIVGAAADKKIRGWFVGGTPNS
jgi:hypothetical protein